MQTWEITRRAPSQSWSIFLNANQHECVCVTAVDTSGKVWRVLLLCGKLILLVGLLYVFVCSLDILSSAFQLVGGE